ncbi:MAG: DUF3008 family protein [Deltaproteobacteria bacterium]|nr:DUF3008 family protein [Deltaproteobacteria bacterium]
MPAKSRAQQKLMGIALGIKRGKTAPDYSPQAARLARTMSEPDLEEFAAAPRAKLPPRLKAPAAPKPRQKRPRRMGLAERARKEQARRKNPGQPVKAPRNRLEKLAAGR